MTQSSETQSPAPLSTTPLSTTPLSTTALSTTPLSTTAKSILHEVERCGLLLVHDKHLPSVTSFVTGGPIAGSWWSHPLANAIYNALAELEDRVLTLKLIRRKNTLVAGRLWPDLLAVIGARDAWQMVRLTDESHALLERVDRAGDAVLLDRSDAKAAEQLEQRLLVHSTEVHTETGTHRKALQSWSTWADDRNIEGASNPARSRGVIEDLVEDLIEVLPADEHGKLLPW